MNAAGEPDARGDLRTLAGAFLVATMLVLGGGALRWLVGFGSDGLSPLRLLVAVGFLLTGVLLRRRAPAWAWVATVLAAAISAIELVAGLRVAGLLTDGSTDVRVLAAATLALAAPVTLAAGYAVRRRAVGRSRWSTIAAVASVGLVVVVAAAAAWAVVQGVTGAAALSTAETAPIRIAGRLAVAAIGIGLLIGGLRDALPVVTTAFDAWKAQPASGPRTSFASHLADAAAPARAAQRRMAREDERARLAADLHATVLPGLRRAAAAASAVPVPDDVRAGLQRALEDVEGLMHGRQSIVLEQFGLVAALEWLAERTEQSGRLRVELELDGSNVDRREAIAPDVARAAFRIALLAIDNVARHAQATTATMVLRADARTIELAITDDGRGGGPVANAPASGRGIADMLREASATGGTIRTTPPPGATVTATWPASRTA